MTPSDFDLFINLIGPKIAKTETILRECARHTGSDTSIFIYWRIVYKLAVPFQNIKTSH
jgi:hypothetical protein